MKKIFSVITILIMLAQNTYADNIYTSSTENIISDGITHTYTERLTDNGWQKINIIKADLSKDNVKIRVLYDKRGISYRNDLKSMVENSDALAAVNADFFDMTQAAGRTTPLGLTISNGEIISSPSFDTNLAALYETESEVFADYFNSKIYICADNGNKAEILHINKFHPTASIVMFTKDWGKYTDPVSDGSKDMVVENSTVKEIITNSQGTEIPENGYVLRVNPSINNFFDENFVVGDHAELSISITPDPKSIKNAVGGGTILVSNGKQAKFTSNIAGYNPRTAAGVSENGKSLYLVTVEGRESNTRGMTQYELADLMLEIGCYTAINFDGGGSTEMVAKNDKGAAEIINTPSEGKQRKISTALGVTSQGEKPIMSSLKLETSKETVFLGDYVDVWCYPKDNYGNPIDPSTQIYYYADDNGYFVENKYYPAKSGTCKITVVIGNVSESININVPEKIANLTFYPPFFSGNSASLSLVASDIYGNKSTIAPENINYKVVSGDATISNGNVVCNGKTEISAEFGGKSAFCRGNYDYKSSGLIFDEMSSSVSEASFTVLPAMLNEDNLISLITNNMIRSKAAISPLCFSYSGIQNTVSVTDQYVSNSGVNSFIVLKNTNSSVISNGIEQWKNLVNIKNGSSKNVFILMTNGLDLADESEKRLFNNILKDMKDSNKNVFVIYTGDVCSSDNENGIRYLCLKYVPKILLSNFSESVKDAAYLKIYADENTVRYEFSSLAA